MPLLADTARFRPDDPDELVLASLVCPICLSGTAVDWVLAGDGYDASVLCVCDRCEQTWLVYLTPHQLLRLGLIADRAA
jgi:hypothetical protein